MPRTHLAGLRRYSHLVTACGIDQVQNPGRVRSTGVRPVYIEALNDIDCLRCLRFMERYCIRCDADGRFHATWTYQDVRLGAVQLCVDTDHCEQRRTDIASGRWI